MNDPATDINLLLSEIKLFLTSQKGIKNIRLNIMTTQSTQLKIVAHTSGFDSEELNISLTKGQGCSGKAWNTKTMAISDLAKDVQWLSQEAQKRVKTGLRVILSLPLFDPDYPKLNRVIGTITADSTEPVYETLKNSVPELLPFVQQASVLLKKSGL